MLPQASVAVYIRVLVQVHPWVFTGAPSSLEVTVVGRPQLSITIGTPANGNDAGLQPRFEPAGQEVNTGLV